MQIAVMDNVGALTCIHTQISLFSLSLPPSLILDALHKTSGVWGVFFLFFLCAFVFSVSSQHRGLNSEVRHLSIRLRDGEGGRRRWEGRKEGEKETVIMLCR